MSWWAPVADVVCTGALTVLWATLRWRLPAHWPHLRWGCGLAALAYGIPYGLDLWSAYAEQSWSAMTPYRMVSNRGLMILAVLCIHRWWCVELSRRDACSVRPK